MFYITRHKGINFILMAVFTSLTAALMFSFIADTQFNAAQRLEDNYRWKRAGEKYELAAKLDPFNAKYHNELGSFLVRQSEYRKDKDSWIEKAEKLYKHAIRLNPRCAEHYLKLGKIQLTQGLKGDRNKIYIAEAIKNLKKAIENDPNGFNTPYSVGFTGIAAWEYLDNDEKELVLAKLRYSLQIRPQYWRYIYPQAWRYAKGFEFLKSITPDNLESNQNLYNFILQDEKLRRFRKEQMKAVNFSRKKEEPEKFKWEENEKLQRIVSIKKIGNRKIQITDLISLENWQGRSRDGKYGYENGTMFWTGIMSAAVSVPVGEAVIKIQARGTPADDIWPYMTIGLDGKEVGEMLVDSTEWKEYVFNINTNGGIKVLSITFENDGGNWTKKEDRNLYIGKAEVARY